MQNYYEILQVDKNASEEMIEKAYKLLAKKYHPDMQPEEKKSWAEENFKQINEAYTVLSDKQKRIEYDEQFKLQDTDIYEKYQQLLEQNKLLKNQLEYLQIKLENLKTSPTITGFKGYIQNDSQPQTNSSQESSSHQNNAFVENSSRIGNNLYHTITRKKGKKDIMAFFLTLLIFIGIFLILWMMPFTKKYLVSLYENNFVIKGIVDFFFTQK